MKKKIWKGILAASSVVLILAIIATLIHLDSLSKSRKDYEEVRSQVTGTIESVDPSARIDFETLKEKNDDIYAWITIPETNVDYPIVQSYSESDAFYLDHNINKNYDINGAIYTEKLNNTDFSDPVTVIYGHNMIDGSMFQTLHKFRDKEFFEKNKYIYIYTPGRTLTYTIVAAYKGDNRHLLNSYDFTDDEVLEKYYDSVSSPNSLECNTREYDLKKEDKIITLSTCIGNETEYRYLVQGVLTDDTARE